MQINEIKSEILHLKRTAFGVSVPELRKLAQKIAKENYQEFVEKNKNDSFELRMVHAFVLGYAKEDINVLLNDFAAFMPYVNDWAINDALCQNFKLTRKYPEIVWKFFNRIIII